MDIFACVGGRDACLGASGQARKVIKPKPEGDSAAGPARQIEDAPQHRVKTIPAVDVMEHFVQRRRCCNHCKTPLVANTDALKVAKVGTAYFCFCDEDCWLHWLPAFAGIESGDNSSPQSQPQHDASDTDLGTNSQTRQRSQSACTPRSVDPSQILCTQTSHSYRAPAARVHLL